MPVTVQNSSLTQPSLDYLMNVAGGFVENTRTSSIRGRVALLGTTEQTVWSEGGVYSFPSSASIMTLSSSNANDTLDGTGSRTIKAIGLDANYDEVIETVTLNGLTGVSTVNSFLRINNIVTSTSGSGKTNTGIIYIGTGTITAGKPANVFNLIVAGDSNSTTGIFTTPNQHSLYIHTLEITTLSAQDEPPANKSPNTFTMNIFLTKESNNVRIKANTAHTGATGQFSSMLLNTVVIPHKTDIDITGSHFHEASEVNVNFLGILRKEEQT